jgi:hypothetical protein
MMRSESPWTLCRLLDVEFLYDDPVPLRGAKLILVSASLRTQQIAERTLCARWEGLIEIRLRELGA